MIVLSPKPMSSSQDDGLWLSTRILRRPGQAGWTDWMNHLQLPQLREVRSIDPWCNPCLMDCGHHPLGSPHAAWERVHQLPTPRTNEEYYLLFMNALVHPPISDRHFKLLGHDLSDETQTSSLLNCGPWKGKLQPIAARVGANGLLGLEDAREAQRILPESLF